MQAADIEDFNDFRVLRPQLPKGIDALNTVVIHGDITGKPYSLLNFKVVLESIDAVKDIETLGTFEMNKFGRLR